MKHKRSASLLSLAALLLSIALALDECELQSIPDDAVDLPVRVDYLVNGSNLRFTGFSFIASDSCQSREFTYSIEKRTESDADFLLEVNDAGDTLTIKSDDRSLVQRYPRSSTGFQFNLNAASSNVIMASIPFTVRFYELEVPGVGKQRFPTLTSEL